jgi:hypothetical protein
MVYMGRTKGMTEPNQVEANELVIARLSTLPPNIKISIGGHGDFSKDEIIRAIEKGEDVGKKYVEIQMAFLKAIANGSLYKTCF